MKRTQKIVAVILAVMMLFGEGEYGSTDVWAAVNVAITEANFPDQAFRSYVKKFDKNENGYLSEEEIGLVTTIDVEGSGIKSLRGVECFSALRNLSCENNQLVSINVGANTALDYLDCSNNQLSSLNINRNTELTSLYCQKNRLSGLDLSRNVKLVALNCSENHLMALDLSKNTSLNSLNCEKNHLSQLNLRSNEKLASVSCGYNRLVCLDFSNCSVADIAVDAASNVYNIGDGNEGFALDTLSAYGFRIGNAANWQGAVVKNGIITDITAPKITYNYNCGKNIIVTFTLTVGGVQLSEEEFPDENLRNKLQECDQDNDGALSEEERSSVTKLYLSGLGIRDLTGISHFQALQELYCDHNQLTSLDLYGNPELVELWCSDNQLDELYVNNNTKLETLYCYRNRLETIDVTQTPRLGSLNCSANPLTELSVRYNPFLSRLNCAKAKLTDLDVSENTELEYLNCEGNQLICLDLASCPKLRRENVSADGNCFDLGTVNIKGYDLKQLAGNGFDGERTSNWDGAVYESGVIGNFSRNRVTYTYDCGNGITADFTFLLTAFTHEHEYRTVVTEPTCTKQGYTTYICTYCGEYHRADYTDARGHSYRKQTVPASTSKSGYSVYVCSRCGNATGRETIYPARSMALSGNTYVYNGQQKRPAVTVTDSKGSRIGSKNYTIVYTNNVKAGKATVTVKLKGDYSGSLTKTFTIKPPSSKFTRLKPKKQGFDAYWKKQPRQVSGYQIAYSTSSKFTKKTTKNIKINTIGSTYKKFSGLKKKKKYYVRIRTFLNVRVNGKMTTVYSAWSSVKTVKTK